MQSYKKHEQKQKRLSSNTENNLYPSDQAGARTRDPILKRDVLYLLSYLVCQMRVQRYNIFLN